MGYKIMNRELTGYSLSGFDCPQVYERNKKYHISKKYNSYGDVLVKTQKILSGFQLKLSIFYRNHWYWKPFYHLKHRIYYFHWLFFMFWIDREYTESKPEIIKDHLKVK
jgi:hypothetical protein